MKSSIRKIFSLFVVIAIVFSLMSTLSFATVQIDQSYAIKNKGVTNIYRELLALPNLGNVMYMGAHPDDESNAFLANLTWGFKVNGSYVVSNWGEGGDNWIGQELYGALGVIRSQELKSARMFDGTTQYYIGAYDFGYSVSLAESLIDNNPLSATYAKAGNWSWQIYAYNLARLIRLDRPDVFISGHWGYGGHGQHQANGYIANKAYELAGDPTYVITDYDGNPLPAWQPKKLYASATATYNRNPDGSTSGAPADNLTGAENLVIDNGTYDNLLTLSYAEWGNLGRGQHKCQNVTPSANKGASTSTWGLKAKTDDIALTDSTTLFGGIDITYNRIWKEMQRSGNKKLVKAKVLPLISTVDRLIDNYTFLKPLKIESDLATAMKQVKSIEKLIKGNSFNNEAAVQDGTTQRWLDLIKTRLGTIARMIYGVDVDISSNDTDITPGQQATITATAWVRTAGAQSKVTFPTTAMADGKPTVITVPDGWTVEGTDPVDVTQGDIVVAKRYVYKVTVPDTFKDYTGPFNAPYDEYMPSRNANFPYGSLSGDPANWNSETNRADESQINLGLTTVVNDPYSHAPIAATVPFVAKSQQYSLEKEPDLRVVPKISLLIKNENAMLKKSGSEQTSKVEVVVKNNMTTAANDILLTAAAEGWTSDSQTLSIASQGGEQTVILNLTVPAGFEGSKQVQVTGQLGSEIFNEGFQVINYNHIDAKNFYRASIQNLTVADFAVADGLKIGYVVTGKDDFVVDLIRLMYNDPNEGINNVTKLTPADLTNGATLKGLYDTIVVGKMAWSSIPAIQTKVQVLVDFANAGGNLVVHYQNARVSNNMPLAPTPFPLGGTNINNEKAAVMMNFGTAAEIAANDFYYGIDLGLTGSGPFESTSTVWNGWKQQRTEWTAGRTADPAGELTPLGYKVLFYGNDPGDTSTGRPAVLYMPMSNGGSYTYSSVVWERQLMDLVPGSYKLYSNLLSMGNR